MWDLHSQCSFQIVSKSLLSMNNLALRDPDLERVVMTNMKFESDMRDRTSDGNEERTREAFLVSSFENIVRIRMGIPIYIYLTT